jgi:hypothetical protein
MSRSGFTMLKVGAIALGGVVVAFAAAGLCLAQEMSSLYPWSDEAPGWQRIPESYKAVNRKDLTPVFDGGYQIYVDFDLQVASTTTYEYPQTDERITLTILFFRKLDDARSYFCYLASSVPDDAKDVEVSETSFSYSSAGVFQRYSIADRYMGEIVSSGDSDGIREASQTIMRGFTQKIATVGGDVLSPTFVLPKDGVRKYTYTCATSWAAAEHIYPFLEAAKLSKQDEVKLAHIDGATYDEPYTSRLAIINCTDEAAAAKCLKAITESTQDKVVEEGKDSGPAVYKNEPKARYWAITKYAANVIVAYDAAQPDGAKSLPEAAVKHLEKGPDEKGEH